jgi:AcrR family transcriptional regulator
MDRGSKAARKRRYDASGRRAEAERTAARIVDAATELVKAGVQPEALSYAEVAARAGVATRTVYRHFPEPSDLPRAVAMATLARFTGGRLAVDRPGVAAQLATFHEMMCADPQLFRVLLVTPLRSGMNYNEYLKGVFADVLDRIPSRQRDAAAATFEMLANPYAWEVLHTYWRLPRAQITRTCLAAIQAVADRFEREPELLDPAGPLPALFRAPVARDHRAPRPARTTTRTKATAKGRKR